MYFSENQINVLVRRGRGLHGECIFRVCVNIKTDLTQRIRIFMLNSTEHVNSNAHKKMKKKNSALKLSNVVFSLL